MRFSVLQRVCANVLPVLFLFSRGNPAITFADTHRMPEFSVNITKRDLTDIPKSSAISRNTNRRSNAPRPDCIDFFISDVEGRPTRLWSSHGA
jgi:hypothetical protein